MTKGEKDACLILTLANYATLIGVKNAFAAVHTLISLLACTVTSLRQYPSDCVLGVKHRPGK